MYYFDKRLKNVMISFLYDILNNSSYSAMSINPVKNDMSDLKLLHTKCLNVLTPFVKMSNVKPYINIYYYINVLLTTNT